MVLETTSRRRQLASSMHPCDTKRGDELKVIRVPRGRELREGGREEMGLSPRVKASQTRLHNPRTQEDCDECLLEQFSFPAIYMFPTYVLRSQILKIMCIFDIASSALILQISH